MQLSNWFASLATAGRDFLDREYRRRQTRRPKSIRELCVALYSNEGDAISAALAAEVIAAYYKLDDLQRLEFFKMLANEYSPDAAQISECANRCCKNMNAATLRALIRSVEPPRQHLLRRMNMAHRGTGAIIDMRRDLLEHLPSDDRLQMVDDDYSHLLTSWFNPGFLELRRIDWHTPASILEKLILHEAVHEIEGWHDLRRRLDEDRRCFGFFHPALRDEPLIFIEIALEKGLAGSIRPLLSVRHEKEGSGCANTAIFYSISNCQPGLKGIPFGSFLIKEVVLRLKEELPHIKEYLTLSPIPGFSRWLSKEPSVSVEVSVSEQERRKLEAVRSVHHSFDEECDEELKQLLMRLCAHYLYAEKTGGLPADPVARFHLRNGASIERLNWLGDCSEQGMRQSFGIMVNYRYDLEKVELNHERLLSSGEVSTSRQFQELLR